MAISWAHLEANSDGEEAQGLPGAERRAVAPLEPAALEIPHHLIGPRLGVGRHDAHHPHDAREEEEHGLLDRRVVHDEAQEDGHVHQPVEGRIEKRAQLARLAAATREAAVEHVEGTGDEEGGNEQHERRTKDLVYLQAKKLRYRI